MQHVASGTCPATLPPLPSLSFPPLFWGLLAAQLGPLWRQCRGRPTADIINNPKHTHTDRRHRESFYGVATLNELAACRSSLLLSLVVIVLSAGFRLCCPVAYHKLGARTTIKIQCNLFVCPKFGKKI